MGYEAYGLEDLFYIRCAVENPSWLGDGICSDFSPYNSSFCGFDKGDCVGNPKCTLDESSYAKIKNVALGKPTEQISTYSSSYYQGYFFLSSVAVDGDIRDENTAGYLGGITDTEGEYDPWWTVSLGNKYFINRIVIFNRYPYYSSRLQGFRLEIMNQENNNTKKNNQSGVDVSTTANENVVFTYNDKTVSGTSPGAKITIIIPGRSFGDKVKISIPDRYTYLQMREVEIYGWMYERE